MGEQQVKVWPELVLALVFAGTTLAVILLTWTGFWAGFSLYAVSDEAQAERSALLTTAFVVGTAVPLVCAIITLARKLRGLFVINVVLLLLTVLVGAMSTVETTGTGPPDEPPSTPAGCQVYSGSDNTCPGG